MTDSIAEVAHKIGFGLDKWVLDAIRDARPYGKAQHVVSVYAGVPNRLTLGYVVAGMGTPLNEAGETLRAHLMGQAS